MTGRRFIDTNVVVYAYDSSAGAKRATAQQVLREAAAGREDVISVQVLGEFFHATVTRKRVLTSDKARIAIARPEPPADPWRQVQRPVDLR
ncbi:MAG: hypothetical protein MUE50_12830 [Pirellulaceae bacterium]|jgi:predicted nucleic acid-binding protein|nr:hypothetical protein [Pirellulaceae bacterium]